MNRYKVTVCRFGYAITEAESEERAKNQVSSYSPEQIHWNDQNDKMPLFIVAYAEREMDKKPPKDDP